MPSDIPEKVLPLSARILDREDLASIKHGIAAMTASGAQPEFVAHNILQANALNTTLILRAGTPPQYNKRRSSKSGLNLTKTSNQGFFKGALSLEERFSRLGPDGHPLGLDKKDKARLKNDIFNPDYQHRMQLDVNMQDILRELSEEGCLMVLGFDLDSGLLRLGYKEGKGPPRDAFDGQFVIGLYEGDSTPQFYSRPWDRPEAHPDYKDDKGVIAKPETLHAIDDALYEMIFHHQFKLFYTEDKSTTPDHDSLKPAMVLANRPRTCDEFLRAIPESDPLYETLARHRSLGEMLKFLQNIKEPREITTAFIQSIYDKQGAIIAGDWDGLAIGHPVTLDPTFRKVYNTFDPINGAEEASLLLETSNQYLTQLKEQARLKAEPDRNRFDAFILSIEAFDDREISEFALMRAGCITPFEFVYQQLINIAYRHSLNPHYGEKYPHDALQTVLDTLLDNKKDDLHTEDLALEIRTILTSALKSADPEVSPTFQRELENHVLRHFLKATKDNLTHYTLPHLHADLNIKDLFQHGFDMRNPYGSNLDGPWLIISKDGSVMYGKTQEELIAVLLTPDFLKDNLIDINWGANMGAGWARVIEKQLEFIQPIPNETIIAYVAHLHDTKNDSPPPSVLERLKLALTQPMPSKEKNPQLAERFEKAEQWLLAYQKLTTQPKEQRVNTRAYPSLSSLSSKPQGPHGEKPPKAPNQNEESTAEPIKPSLPRS